MPTKLIALIALALLSPQAISSQHKSASLDAAEAVAELSLMQQEIDSATAPIKSRQQLQRYLSRTPEAPLHKLPDSAKRNFINSLIFTGKGLGSYSYLPLADHLSATEIYQTLSLFGVQSSTGVIPKLKAHTTVERSIMARPTSDFCETPDSPLCQAGGGTKTDYICSSDPWDDKYSCTYSFGDICTKSC
ncbi:hypothetical protein IEQ11_17745 [Lysobacter capsici]|uniref:hypothetical protein n=1 Tax=Lysobacter capsici TaxID=435897 RepID=UPI001783C87C|nr:hypothetical protein [Lysobacter capsici]UOF13577.1 hypothetical protein IEQ11_17745 [Lysobacter capsici]